MAGTDSTTHDVTPAGDATIAHATVPLEVVPAVAPQPLAASAGDRCGSCGNSLAPDQRYCVECGERRGAARFAPPAPAAAARTEPVRTGRRRQPAIGSGGTLIAGVATLLLAMGVGVLIGQSGNSTSSASRTPPVQVVTVGGGGVAATAGAAGAARHTASKASRSKSKSKSKSSSKTHAVAKPAAKNLPPPTVTVGAKGHGPGFQNGKFTGHFFGP
jgi:hypothetical protein